VRAKGLFVVAIPLIALIGIISTSLALQFNERQQRSVSLAAFNVINGANEVLTDALNAETGVRGYAATRDQGFLGPYNLALGRIGQDRAALLTAARVDGDARQARTVDAMAGQAFASFTRLRTAIGSGLSGSGLNTALLASKAMMDTLRSQIAGLIRAPSAALVTHRNEVNSLESAIDTINIVGFVLGILAGLAGIALFTSGVARRVAASAANAGRLGLGQPLAPQASSGDEIGQLAAALARAEQVLASRTADLTTARDEALLATQAKTRFISTTSHELRTPLNSILGFTQLLEISDLSGEDQDSVQRILSAGRHLLALINELIDIARIESGELSLSVEPVAVVPLAEQVCSLMAPLAAERSVTIGQRYDDPGLFAMADRQRFTQILVNLVSNAVKYNSRGGTITVTCQDGEDTVSVIVADTGHGISETDLERIFIPFERLGAEQTGIEGTGIGLPLARALTEAMGGSLTVTSAVGEGSTFTFTLQRAAETAGQAAPEAEPAAPPGRPRRVSDRLSVLYIEDNPANVEVVTRFLHGWPNITLRTAATGRDGLAAATSDPPDLVFLDLHLPDLHGEQVLEELRADPATSAIPVVVLSAEATPRVIRRLRASGARAYLTKPLVLAQLGDLLESLLATGPSQEAR
jgi:signal transduction histidine kinase/CheY-like chemotaxis protein